MTRVLLREFSPLMQSIIAEALSNRPDVMLIRSTEKETGESDGQVDVVLTPASNPEDAPELMDLLWRWPKCRVVAVATSGRTAVMYELFPQKLVLGDLSAATLVNVILGVSRR